MAASRQQQVLFVLLGFISIASFGLRHSAYAQNGPAILFQRALFCFNNRLIYTGCNEAFRLNESGEIRVPPEATESYCNGPCLAETEMVLKCVDDIMSDFEFYNRARPRDIRNALRGGCGSSFSRGNFNARDYAPEAAFGRAEKNLPSTFISFSVAATILVCAPLFL